MHRCVMYILFYFSGFPAHTQTANAHDNNDDLTGSGKVKLSHAFLSPLSEKNKRSFFLLDAF